jgi:hypothetical protein
MVSLGKSRTGLSIQSAGSSSEHCYQITPEAVIFSFGARELAARGTG